MKKSPWAWVPTLYFAEALPYVAVMTISLIMYKRLGLSNADITLYTSWLYLPWVIKPLWSPFVDLIKTKRWWIVAMQLLIGAALGGVAFTIPGPFWLTGSLCFFWLMAFSVLYARTGQSRTGILRRHPLDVLPHCHHLRTRTARHAGRQPRGADA